MIKIRFRVNWFRFLCYTLLIGEEPNVPFLQNWRNRILKKRTRHGVSNVNHMALIERECGSLILKNCGNKMQHVHAREHATVIEVFLTGYINLDFSPLRWIELYICWAFCLCNEHRKIYQAAEPLFVVFWDGIQETNFMLSETDDSQKPVFWRVYNQTKVSHSEQTV